MGARSSVEKLPDPVRKQLEKWLVEFQQGRLTLDQVMQRMQAQMSMQGLPEGEAPSRSAVHRFAGKFEKIAARLARSQDFADALAKEAGPQISDGKGMQVLLQAYQSLAYDFLGNMDEEEVVGPDVLLQFAKSIQAASSAQKTDADRSLKLKQEALREAAARVDQGAKKHGWSADTAKQVRAEILGVNVDKLDAG